MRFVLSEDREGQQFRLAPLQSRTLIDRVAEAQRGNLPDSLVVLTPDGALCVKSAAVLELAQRLGGFWRLAAYAVAVLPRAALDRLYEGIAANRYSIFGREENACPILPPHLRDRFAPHAHIPVVAP